MRTSEAGARGLEEMKKFLDDHIHILFAIVFGSLMGLSLVIAMGIQIG